MSWPDSFLVSPRCNGICAHTWAHPIVRVRAYTSPVLHEVAMVELTQALKFFYKVHAKVLEAYWTAGVRRLYGTSGAFLRYKRSSRRSARRAEIGPFSNLFTNFIEGSTRSMMLLFSIYLEQNVG